MEPKIYRTMTTSQTRINVNDQSYSPTYIHVKYTYEERSSNKIFYIKMNFISMIVLEAFKTVHFIITAANHSITNTREVRSLKIFIPVNFHLTLDEYSKQQQPIQARWQERRT